ncbi:MAG TPA: M15 family metallopeptidase [Gemmatimonadaceae bacterium]|nr:M15 family metallopeptidase [Gemmatimonadaceae bacterium]
MHTPIRRLIGLASLSAVAAFASCSSGGQEEPRTTPTGPNGRTLPWPQSLTFEFARRPDTLPTRWRGLVGEYGPDTATRLIALERDQRLTILDKSGYYTPLSERNDSVFEAPLSTAAVSGNLTFHRDSTGRGTSLQMGDMVLQRRRIEPPSGANQLRITPVHDVDSLRVQALAARPPAESGLFKQPDLVEVTTLDTTLRLEIRYAGSNNFLGTKIYEQARAFMQRPAAEALARASRAAHMLGFGLLIHDAYRPWYVTKIFWDATPDSLRWMVANPAEGSKHNRGAAVDLSMYELRSGKIVEMPSTYDESTTRAYANYPGGTALQRWNRAILRRVMEHEGFAVNPQEWWHFDYRDWKSYPILNIPFDQVRPAPRAQK